MKNVSGEHDLLRGGSIFSRAAVSSRTAATPWAGRQAGDDPWTKRLRAAPTPAHVSSQQVTVASRWGQSLELSQKTHCGWAPGRSLDQNLKNWCGSANVFPPSFIFHGGKGPRPPRPPFQQAPETPSSVRRKEGAGS